MDVICYRHLNITHTHICTCIDTQHARVRARAHTHTSSASPLARSQTQTCPSYAASAAPPAEPARSATTNATQGTHARTHARTHTHGSGSTRVRSRECKDLEHTLSMKRAQTAAGPGVRCVFRKMCCNEMRCVITTWSIASPSTGAGRRSAAATPDISKVKNTRETAAVRIVVLRAGTAAVPAYRATRQPAWEHVPAALGLRDSPPYFFLFLKYKIQF